ncbi:polar amino acid transport system permease protein [Pilibacter termitis]|uniref:Polar amino acid transport system permease protein n=1 Tax=Pilibacter termitis TaxID=263852 RepID=A0A1T4MPE0_9ENTE|nr:amino acid ABC transporter permease [Pilibacter termitis]SJZ68741.1 polar amino acid transport system permease protein [Pilibacter termitis]
MQHSGIELFFEGKNLVRLLLGLFEGAKIAGFSLVIGIVLGIFFGLLRTVKNSLLTMIFRIYLEIFRIVPLLVLLFVFYYILPEQTGGHISNTSVSILVFSLWISAEMSEITRSSLISIPSHQLEAARALGLSKMQQFFYVQFPQAIPFSIAPTLNLVTRVIKTTSLLLMIGVSEVIKVGTQINENYVLQIPTAPLWIYGFIFFLYFALCYPLTYLAKRFEKGRRA